MRLLLLTTSFRQEGPNNTFLHIASAAKAAGIHVWAGSLAGGGAMEAVYARSGVPTLSFGGAGLARLHAASRVRRFLKEQRIDVVCSQLLRGEVVGAVAVRGVPGCGLLCTVQNEDPYRIVLLNPPKALLSRWALRRAAKVVVVSRALRDFVLRHQGVRPEAVEVIPNAVDPAGLLTRHEARRPVDLPPGRPLVGCVGRLSRQKGQDLLIAAFHRIARRFSGARLVLIGAGPLRPLLDVAALRGAGRGRIDLLGWRADVAPYLPFLDVYAQPSRWEGMPFATLEAMGSGVAVVASSAGGLRELVDGGCGALAPPGRAAPLAQALQRMVEDEDARASCAARGRERVLREYTAESMSEAYLRAFSALAEERA